ncbi:Gustatory receptor [Caenorhabditis elegans]|uniref:Gustatory receptor n=1 Tax=Caenorhabditis elegans TaxID=6239 RepID=Q94270_CAEEL|nr:Gustatory receptor [Caenorhabditis elegans]CCD72624.2 Gustatory receptor [Caenorhabditis elegans]|eukprot:NP_509080.2 Uncharacterized protein CELE_K10C2.2 [Caenorhabditis elegans]
MPSSFEKMLKSLRKKFNCKFEGLKLEQEKAIVEAVLRCLFLYLARNPIYVTILIGIFLLHAVYQVLMFPSSLWNMRTVLFGISSISTLTCISMTTVTKNELSRFFDSPLDIRNNRASLLRTSVVTMQALFGVALVLLSVQFHFNNSPYDIVLVILCIIITTRLVVVLVIWTNCVYRIGEKLSELGMFLEKCNGRTEYEHLALKMKDITICLQLHNRKVSVILLLWLILITYCLLLILKNMMSITVFAFISTPFCILFLVCSYANSELEKLKIASLRLFDLQFITPAINSLVNYFWMSRKIEQLPALEVKYLFETTYSNALKVLFYCFVVFISFEHCITAALKCRTIV